MFHPEEWTEDKKRVVVMVFASHLLSLLVFV